MYIYRVDDGESRRRGAAGPQRRAHDDGLAQEGGVVWRRGGADGRLGKVIVDLSWMGWRKMVAATSDVRSGVH